MIFSLINSNDKVYSNINNTFIDEYIQSIREKDILVLTSNSRQAINIYENIKKSHTYLWLEDEFITENTIALSNEMDLYKNIFIQSIYNSKRKIIITNVEGLLKKIPSKLEISNNRFLIEIDQPLSIIKLSYFLVENGYEKVKIVDSPGTFALRGFVIDVMLDLDNAFRILLDEDKIEDIKKYDPVSQRTIKSLTNVEIKPFIYKNNTTTIIDLLRNYQLILINELQIKEKINLLVDCNDVDFVSKALQRDYVALNYYLGNNDVEIYEVGLEESSLENYATSNQTVVCSVGAHQLEHFKKYNNIKIITNVNEIIPHKLNIIVNGFVDSFKYNGIVYLNLNKQSKTKKSSSKYKPSIDISDIEINDYVVHDIYGVGKFIGLVKLTIRNIEKEYLKIMYLNDQYLYVPVEKLLYLRKYDISSGILPRINALSAKKWQNSKSKINKHLKNVANQIIKNAALRKQQQGIEFQIINEVMEEFDKTCNFDLTTDQYNTYLEILNDMSSGIIMDRLVCGDVGFGKTELAFRAAFLAIMNGYQVLYLCPTTILARQQYKKAIERFVGYNIKIELFDRNITKKKEVDVLNSANNGELNLIIGTHKLTNEKLLFNKLGLIIIDEEQRFGVTIKEKIKAKALNADLLTLSATPIPRTLQMSLTGLKDFSIIQTPPMERVAVITYLLNYNKHIIKEAIENELQRKGQIFYLENRIEAMENTKKELLNLIPDLKVAIIHAKIDKKKTETIMEQFINGKYDLLLATTIIENGIDMPNVNTIIVNNADRLGLGQLYQLRGRVGRSNRQAYAYLTIKNDYIITDEARSRLNAIKEFAKLGSGIDIAKRDLAIRGAGDFLGREQAGFIETIGIDMYNKMLEIELAKQLGTYIEEPVYEKPLLDVNTACLDAYIEDDDVRLETHQLINNIKDYKTYIDTKNEIKDRFGAYDEDIEEYLLSIWFEKIARLIGVDEIIIKKSEYHIFIKPQSNINIKYLLNNYQVKIESERIVLIEPRQKYNMRNLISIMQSLV